MCEDSLVAAADQGANDHIDIPVPFVETVLRSKVEETKQTVQHELLAIRTTLRITLCCARGNFQITSCSTRDKPDNE